VTAEPAPRPDGLHIKVGVAGWRGVLADPAGRTVWTCRHTHLTVAQARECAEQERDVPGLVELGFRLRQLREAAGLSQAQVAAALECSTSKVSRIETGEVLATPRDVRDLADLYRADPQQRDTLVGGRPGGPDRPRGLGRAAPAATRRPRPGRRPVTGDRELYAALLGLRRRSPRRPAPPPERAPPLGPGAGARTRNPAKDGRAPHRQPPTSHPQGGTDGHTHPTAEPRPA